MISELEERVVICLGVIWLALVIFLTYHGQSRPPRFCYKYDAPKGSLVGVSGHPIQRCR